MPTLHDLSGMAEARDWGLNLARDVKLCFEGKLDWKHIDPACLLYGPAGTGKTTFATILATTCGLPLILTSFAEWQSAGEGHLGSTIYAMKDAFAKAVCVAPCILLIDELDSIPARGGGEHAAYWNGVTNAVLKEFDNIASNHRVIIIGACNHPELLDPALIRSGRMDRMIAVTLPTTKELEGVISFHLTPDERQQFQPTYAGNPLARIARMCSGMTGADVAKSVREARRVARQAQHPLSPADFEEAIDPVSKRPPPENQIRTAVHEAGHALVALLLRLSNDISVSVAGRQASHGRTTMMPSVASIKLTTFLHLMTTALAGRAAEEVVFGEPSELSGGNSAQADLAVATRLSCDAVSKYGFSEGGGLVWRGSMPDSELFRTEAMGEEIKAMLDAAYIHAKDLIQSNRAVLEAISLRLINQRVINHADLEALAKEYGGKPPAGTEAFQAQIGRAVFSTMRRAAPPPVPPSYAPSPVYAPNVPAEGPQDRYG